MHDPIGRVPSGYAVHRVGDSWLVLDADRAPDLVQLRLGSPEARRELFARGPVRGRGRAPTITLASGTRIVLRRYRHGGLLGWLTRSLLLGPHRPLSELRVSTAARLNGAPVPPVVCVALWPVLGPLWSGLIGTLEVSDSRGAGAWLASNVDPELRIHAAREVGKAVRALHDAGVEHRDLQLANILLSEDPVQARVIDLDRALFHSPAPVPASRRAQNLGRLVRSAIKNGLWPEARARAGFAAGYIGGDRELRLALRSYLRREQCKLLMHRVSWWLRRPPTQTQTGAAPPRPA